jgi:hypothetical protein
MTSYADLKRSLIRNSQDILAPLINRWLIERDYVIEEVEDWVHPSGLPAGKLCFREIFFQLYTPIDLYPVKQLTKSYKPEIYRNFDNGNAVHRRWQSYLIEMGITHPMVLKGWEIPILDQKLRIKGHADAIAYPEAMGQNRVQIERAGLGNSEVLMTDEDGGFKYQVWNEKRQTWMRKEDFELLPEKEQKNLWKPIGKPVLVDFKSINDFGFSQINEAQEKHQRQINTYQAWFRRNGYPTMDQCLVLYENKNDQLIKEDVIPFNAALAEDLEQGLQTVQASKKGGKLPTPICQSLIDAAERKCPWAHLCFKHNTYSELLKGSKRVSKPKKTGP